MESKLTDDEAKELAATIRALPGWHAEAYIAMWPSQEDPDIYTVGWVTEVARDGDDNCYLLQSADEWPRLVEHLGEPLEDPGAVDIARIN